MYDALVGARGTHGEPGPDQLEGIDEALHMGKLVSVLSARHGDGHYVCEIYSVLQGGVCVLARWPRTHRP